MKVCLKKVTLIYIFWYGKHIQGFWQGKSGLVGQQIWHLITGCHLCVGSAPRSGNAEDLSLYDPGFWAGRKTPTFTSRIFGFNYLAKWPKSCRRRFHMQTRGVWLGCQNRWQIFHIKYKVRILPAVQQPGSYWDMSTAFVTYGSYGTHRKYSYINYIFQL